MNRIEQLTLHLRKLGFTFNDDGTINNPRDGQSHFHQNLMLSLYVNDAVDRKGSKYILRTSNVIQLPTPVPELIPA